MLTSCAWLLTKFCTTIREMYINSFSFFLSTTEFVHVIIIPNTGTEDDLSNHFDWINRARFDTFLVCFWNWCLAYIMQCFLLQKYYWWHGICRIFFKMAGASVPAAVTLYFCRLQYGKYSSMAQPGFFSWGAVASGSALRRAADWKCPRAA